jgi:dynein heavy chain 2
MFSRYPSQIICLFNELTFSVKVHEAIQNNSVPKLVSKQESFLAELTTLSHGANELTLAKIKSLILDVIHQSDVLNQLIHAKVKEVSDWPWFKQLKYVRRPKEVFIEMANTSFFYTYEYQGNASKLVHTPLTDKCYLTLTQAMHMGFGGNPYGPAGTGKTESVKALGQAFARQVLVFNCDEGLDFHSMGRIFTGLVKCGAWGCFDEFNRLLE